MPSSYTTSLRLVLPVTGELANSWGNTVNTDLTALVDQSVAGYLSVAMTDADYTLTNGDGSTANQARYMYLNITGTLTAARNIIAPTPSKLYHIKNATTGGFAITLKTTAGTGVSIPNGSAMVLLCDGTNVVDAVTQFSSGSFTNLAYTGTLTGGTGILNIGAGQVYKDASGNVGIGNASPTASLHIGNGTTQKSQVINSLGSGTGGGSALILQAASNSLSGIGGKSAFFGGAYDATQIIYAVGGLQIYDGGNQRITIAAAGNVTIAAPSSGVGLTVSGGGITVSAGSIANTDTAAAAYITQVLGNNSSTGYANFQLQIGVSGAQGVANINYAPGLFFAIGPTSNDTTTPIILRNNNATTRVTIAAAGNVTIAAPSSGVALTVSGSITATTGLNVAGNGGFYNAANKFGVDNNAGQTRFYSSGANSATRGSYDFRIIDSIGALDTSVLSIAAAGNVTIAAPSSGTALTVFGAITATTGLNVAGNGGFYNAANKFCVDNNAGQTRFYSSGANSATRGSYDFRIIDSIGALDTSVLSIAAAGNVTIAAPSSGTALTVSGELRVDATTSITAPTGGAAAALPALPVGYVTINIGGTNRKIAYYS